MAEQYANGGQSTLSAGISSTATSLTVVSAAGFSASPNFRLQITSATAGNNNVELLEVTGVSGSTFTVTRAAEPYNGVQTAYSWNAGDFVTQVLTAAAMPTGGATIPSFDTTVLTKLSLAPVAYWKLNDPVGSSTAADSSGNGYTLTVNGTVTFGQPSVVPSDSETSAQGDGSTGYLSAATFPAKVPTGTSVVQCIFCALVNNPSTTGEAVYWGNANTGNQVLKAYFGNRPLDYCSTDATAVSGGPFELGVPHIFGITLELGTQMGAYVDGVSVGKLGNSENIGNSILQLMQGPDGYFGGPMGRVAIFAGVLTPRDWALLMQAFTGV